MKKIEMVIVAIVVMVLSFPLMYIGALLGTGNAKLVFKGDLARKIEVENQIRLDEQSALRDSLLLINSHAYQANVAEKERLATERENLLQEQNRLQMLIQEMQQERDEMELERVRLDEALLTSDEASQNRLKRLARVYGAMKANEAARIMETLTDDLCVNIFQYMGEDRQKAKILAAMSGDKAARLSVLMGIPLEQ